MKWTVSLAIALMMASHSAMSAEAPFVVIRDVGGNIGASASAAMKQASSWKKAAAAHRFQGDCVLMNDRIAIVFSKGAGQAELVSVMSGQWKTRAKFAPLDLPSGRISKVNVVSDGEESAAVEVEFAAGGKTAAVVCELKPAQIFVRTTPKTGASGLKLTAPSRFGVVPEFFSDDVPVDAVKVPVASLAVPTESIYLHVGVDGDHALVGYFWSGSQEAEETISGKDDGKRLESTAIRYMGKTPHITVVVLDTPNACFAGTYDSMPKGTIDVKFTSYNDEYQKKHGKYPLIEETRETRAMPWNMPYVAVWRVDLPVHKDLIDDICYRIHDKDCSIQRKDNTLRTRELLMFTELKGLASNAEQQQKGEIKILTTKWWSYAKEAEHYTFYGDSYVSTGGGSPGIQPAWADQKTGQGMVTPNQENYAVIVYPYDRGRNTPLEAITFMDLMRDIIGKGPCEYVLNAQQAKPHGMAACPVTEQIMRRDNQDRLRETQAEVEALLAQVTEFVEYCHLRQNQQSDGKLQSLKLLDEAVKAHPELAASADRVRLVAGKILTVNPKFHEDQMKMLRESIAALKATMDATDPEAKEKRKKLYHQIRIVGGNAERPIEIGYTLLKQVRSQASVEATLNPSFAEVAKKIRDLTSKALENPEAHEARYQ